MNIRLQDIKDVKLAERFPPRVAVALGHFLVAEFAGRNFQSILEVQEAASSWKRYSQTMCQFQPADLDRLGELKLIWHQSGVLTFGKDAVSTEGLVAKFETFQPGGGRLTAI